MMRVAPAPAAVPRLLVVVPIVVALSKHEPSDGHSAMIGDELA